MDTVLELATPGDGYSSGQLGLNHPQKQGEVTQSTYLNVGELKQRESLVSRGGPELVFPYGRKVEPVALFNCFENEMAYAMQKSTKRPTNEANIYKRHKANPQGPVSTTYPHVLTALNGMSFQFPGGWDEFSKLDKEVQRFYVRQKIRLVGLVGTTNMNYQREMGLSYFPTRLAGMYLMHNNGYRRIEEGDTVLWNVPYVSDDATEYKNQERLYPKRNDERDKVTLIVDKAGPFDYMFFGMDDDTAKENTDKILKLCAPTLSVDINIGVLHFFSNELRHRVLGKALTAAAPGEEFYIYVGQGYCL